MLSGLTTPTGIAFLGPNDFFVIEKNTGKVKRVRNGMVTEVLDPATASHIHRGVAGVAGPVVVTLTPPTSAESQGAWPPIRP